MPPDLPVVRTKTLIPRRRSEVLSRPRLLTILDNVLDLKLFILAAPAGYGKTSLLVDFSHHTQAPVCWYALDELDRDPKRFISHFIASIQGKFPAFGQMSLGALAELSEDKLDLDPVISVIVNDAYENISEHFVFVLDDYHLVRESKPTEYFINRIIQETAENCHFIIASRTLLTLPDLSLLVARSMVDGLSFEELAFLPEEIKQLMAVNYHKTISDEKAEEMISRTEGWITGLLLTTQLSPRGAEERSRVEKVSGVGVYEYLTQQVFDRQSRSMQSFLMRTSLLEEFDANLCERVIGKALGLAGQNWREVIERIQRDNLFVLPVGDETLFLRYHHLFRDFLQNRMRVEKPDETRRIEVELAAYFESVRDWERAIEIYFRIGTTEQIVEMIRKAAPAMILGGRLVTLTDWLKNLPGALADKRPELLSIRGAIAMFRGDSKTALELLDRAVKDLQDGGSGEVLATTLVRRSTVNRYLGNYGKALKDALDANELTRPPFGVPQQYDEALRAEGLVHFQTGDLDKALQKLQESHHGYQDLGLDSDAAKVLLDLGVVNNARGDLEQTETCFTDSLDYWQATNNILWQANVLNNIGSIKPQRGQYEQAVVLLEKALTYSRLAMNPRLEGYTLTSLGDVYRDLRALKEARQAYQQALEVLNRTDDLSLNVYLTLALATLERIAGNLPESEKQISVAFEKASKSGSKYEYNSCLYEQAALSLRKGQLRGLPGVFLQVEEYFSNSGFHVEAFRASVLKLLSDDAEQREALAQKIAEVLYNPQGNIYQALIQMAMECRDLMQTAIMASTQPTLVDKLFNEVINFEKTLPQLHRVISRHSSTVQFEKPRLTIRGLGRMQVWLGGRLITGKDWKTQVVRDLFFFLLARPHGVTKEEIGEAFWPDSDPDTIKLRFKNTIYRLRKAVSKDTVSFHDETYEFNRSMDYEYDVESFLTELEIANSTDNRDEKITHLRMAINSYHGSFLPKLDQEWVLIDREKYHLTFMNTALTLINLYLESKQYAQAVALSNRALEEDNYNEAVYRSAMLAYSGLNDRPAVAKQFEKCKGILEKDLDIQPSAQTISLYNSLMH